MSGAKRMESGSKVVRLDARAARASIGIAEHVRIGGAERERIEALLASVSSLGIRELRVGLSWADAMTAEGRRLYAWLIPTLARRLKIVPCLGHTPPSLGREPRSSSPPRESRAFADWVDAFLTEHGEHFDYVELWNAPNALWSWDARLDPDLALFAATVGNAARWVRERGKKAVLGGLRPADPTFLARLARHGELQHFDAIGIHAQPDFSEPDWPGWKPLVGRIRTALEQLGQPRTEVWITEGGYSTWRHDEGRQVREFLDATDGGADRLYWLGMYDLPIDVATSHGLRVDQREYHLGMRRADGEPKLLYRLWSEGGIENVRSHEFLVRPVVRRRSSRKTTVITGGAGFIGSNVADALLSQGEEVVLLDNLSRAGIERNVRWLRETHGDRVRLALADVRDPFAVREIVARADQVFHFAAQVAVTLSLVSPRHDFDVNASGTLNLLEALRSLKSPPPLVFTSTNKVYGGLPDVVLQRNGSPLSRSIRASARTGSTSSGRSTSTARTDAARASPISTSSTTRAASICRPSCSA